MMELSTDPILDRWDALTERMEAEGRLVDSREEITPQAVPAKRELPKFELESVHDSVKRAHAEAVTWFRHVLKRDVPPYWLLLHGRSGCGKTLLQELTRESLRERGVRCLLANWPLSLDRMGSKGNAAEDELWRLTAPHVLLLDDVGAEYLESERSREFDQDKLYKLFEARQNKWTFVTSNLSPEDIRVRIGARIESRLKRGYNVLVDLSEALDFCHERRKRDANDKEDGCEQ